MSELPPEATRAGGDARSCIDPQAPGPDPALAPVSAQAGQGIGLSEAAARHVLRYLNKRGKGVGVRLGVKTTGCSGLAYKIEYADELVAGDQVFEVKGVKLLVDPKSLPYLAGTELDFVREGLNEGFRFHNPNERDRCGCGESFRV